MNRRRKRTVWRPIGLRRPPAPGAWSMMVIDSSPIREAAQHEYDKVIRALDRAKLEADRFRDEDQPRFAKWLHSHFGALLTESREMQEKLFYLQGLVAEVQHEFYYREYSSIAQAYKKVMWRREHPEDLEAEQAKFDKAQEKLRSEFEKLFGTTDEEFKAAFGLDPEPDGEDPWNQPGAQVPGFTPPPAPSTGRVKDLYRTLARRLHPDAGGKRSAQEMEWWHQTQAAYEKGDVEQLELLVTLTEIQEKGTKQASISILQQITAQFKKGLNALRRELRLFRRDPAWNFSALQDYEPLRIRTREKLVAEKAALASKITEFDLTIKTWEALAILAPAPRKRRARAAEPMPFFDRVY